MAQTHSLRGLHCSRLPETLPAASGAAAACNTALLQSTWASAHAARRNSEQNPKLQILKALVPQICRSSFIGTGAFAAHWTGDTASTWWDLRWQVTAVIAPGLVGISFTGADICGARRCRSC